MIKINDLSQETYLALVEGLEMEEVYRCEYSGDLSTVHMKKIGVDNFALLYTTSSGDGDELLLDATSGEIADWVEYSVGGWGEDATAEEKEEFCEAVLSFLE